MTETQHDLRDIISLTAEIKANRLNKSVDIASRTVNLLTDLVSSNEWDNAGTLIDLIKLRISKVLEYLPHEAICNNIMRHFLKMIRDEFNACLKRMGKCQNKVPVPSIFRLLDVTRDYSEHLPDLKQALLDNLIEYKTEVENSSDNIASQCENHISTNEVIMIYGTSRTVENFLITAAKNRKFQVIVVQGGPGNPGNKMAIRLANSKIHTTLVPDTHIFALMPRVTKVIISAISVFGDGGIKAVSGAYPLALSAKHFSVSVLVLVPMYKFCPKFIGGSLQPTFKEYGAPGKVLSGPASECALVLNPLYDYVRPALINHFITPSSGNSPSNVSHWLRSLYDREDSINMLRF